MKIDQNNYKFYRSFRIKTEVKDKVFVVIKKIIHNDLEIYTNSKSQVIDFNSQGISFNSDVKLPPESEIEFQFKCEKLLSKFQVVLRGHVIRSFLSDNNSNHFNYAIRLSETKNEEFEAFISNFIGKFSQQRLSRYLKNSCFNTRSADLNEAKEVFSLAVNIYKNFIKNEDSKKVKNNIDFENIKKQLNLKNISIQLINGNDSFYQHKSSENYDCEIEESTLKQLRVSGFATKKVITKEITENEEHYYYLSSPILNKFNKPIGLLEFDREDHQGMFTFEDEKVIQLMSYILSSQFQAHRPVFPFSQFEHLNPKISNVPYLSGISKHRFNVKTILDTQLSNPLSSIIIGDESDRIVILDYLKGKLSLNNEVKELNFSDISEQTFSKDQFIILNLENAKPMQLNTIAYLIAKNLDSHFIIHTSYHNWMAFKDEYYYFNLLETIIPPINLRSDDFLDIAQRICEKYSIELTDQVKEDISRGKYSQIQNYEEFESKVRGIVNQEIIPSINKKEIDDALFKNHNKEIKLSEYQTFVDTLTQVSKSVPIQYANINIKKAS